MFSKPFVTYLLTNDIIKWILSTTYDVTVQNEALYIPRDTTDMIWPNKDH